MILASREFRAESGKLMKTDFDPNFGYRYVIWFDYTKKLMKEIRVGDLIAVPNFSDSQLEKRQSLLSATGIMPFHYATGDDLSGYPVFLEKTREEAYSDFEKQIDKSTEETTKIEVNAAPTGLELRGASPFQVFDESQIPIFGGQASILDSGLVGAVYNRGLEKKTITLGKLTKGEIDILLRTEDLIRTHAAVFGYTGTGKSNLISTLVERLLVKNEIPINVVIFDLMGEYFALLADLLGETEGFVGFLEASALSENVQKYMSGSGDLSKAAADLVSAFQIPATLRSKEMTAGYQEQVKKLLDKGKVKILQEEAGTLEDLLKRHIAPHPPSQASRQMMGKIFGIFGKKDLTPDNIEDLMTRLSKELEDSNLNAGTETLLRGWLDAATPYRGRKPFKPSKRFAFDKDADLVDRLLEPNNKDPSLHVILSDHGDSERSFAYEVVCGEQHSVYTERRRKGMNSPLALFVFDEADEYIPQDAKGSYDLSSKTVETLARRGRKFGMGVLIATQRVTYLNTNIIAQPHTYFISKLPRASDRQRITEAFGIPEDMLRETFKFRKGDWLIISHDATGLAGIPIPIHADNAEERIKASLS